MALASTGLICWPTPALSGIPSNQALTATTHRYAFICQAPRAGTLDQIGFRVGTLTTAADLRIRIETVTTGGNPSGTLVAAGADGSVTSPTANTWYDVPIATPPTLTAGQLFAVVIDAPSGSPNLTISRMVADNAFVPYTSLFGASWAKSSNCAIGALKISGVWVTTPWVFPFSALTDTPFASNSTPDERGNVFTAPFDCEVNGIWVANAAAAAVDVRLYNASDTVIASSSFALDVGASTSQGVRYYLTAPVSIDEGSLYRVVLRPTTTTTTTIRRWTYNSSSHASAFADGTFRSTERTNDGSWTDTNTSTEGIGIIVSKVQESGGGATGRYKAKVGGVLVDIL